MQRTSNGEIAYGSLKMYPVKCIGYENENGDTTHGDTHKKVFLVTKSSEHSSKRCASCQKMYSKIRSKLQSKTRTSKRTLDNYKSQISQINDVLGDVNLTNDLPEEQQDAMKTRLKELEGLVNAS